jgi:ubiquinone/menaquinone biosynthesis C-methylase UbiE
MSNKGYWDKIYTTKTPEEVSWNEDYPQMSIGLIVQFDVPKVAKIIDIGGGDSRLVDALLDLGYTNITVLDISESAIDRAKARLGQKAEQVKWVISDILDFSPQESYDLWHDRAVFHFLTKQADIHKYVYRLTQMGTQHLVIGTFSPSGPLKCSGLEITQYDEAKLKTTFGKGFKIIECFTADHITPFDTAQNFTFALLCKL